MILRAYQGTCLDRVLMPVLLTAGSLKSECHEISSTDVARGPECGCPYPAAWVTNDSAAVMLSFTPEAFLISSGLTRSRSPGSSLFHTLHFDYRDPLPLPFRGKYDSPAKNVSHCRRRQVTVK